MSVLLNNAKLQRIDLPGASTASGDVTYANGPAIDVGCFLDDVSSSQRFTLGVVASDASAVLYVEAAELAAGAGGVVIDKRQRLTVQLVGEDGLPFMPAGTYQVIYARPRVLGDLTHWEVFLKAL